MAFLARRLVYMQIVHPITEFRPRLHNKYKLCRQKKAFTSSLRSYVK